MFSGFTGDTKLCYENGAEILGQKFDNLNNDCDNICFEESNKLISESKICVEDCSLDDTYQYEYNNKCYNTCPEGTVSSSSNLCKKILTCPHYYNIDKTECFDTILEGYFLSDNVQNLIDKCHENCKTCDRKEIEGNTNCLTCQDNLFFDNGNCLNSCTYGSYTDDSGKEVCNCNAKCKVCSSENNNLCKSCKNGYYPIYVENINENTLLDCYDTLEGYYFNNGYFYPCYDSCKKCSIGGNGNNHNCDECKENYYKLLNEDVNENNCYLNCNDNYYYFDSNDNYQCTSTKECPSTHNKLIKKKNKCIDSCVKDNLYKNEYNNECIDECPEGSFPENNICKYIETEITTNENTSKESEQNTEKPENTDNTENAKTDKAPDTQNTQTTQITTNNHNSENSVTDTTEVIDNWSAQDFFLGLYIADENSNLSKDDIIKLIREDIINRNLDTLIESVKKEKKDKFIEEDNAIYQITTSDNQNNNIYTNISSIKLGECEDILKKKYDIDENETLIILKIDYYKTGLLIPIIRYEVFDPKNYSKLNLYYCNESLINYNIPV
jgi:hypothetical protein